MATLKEFSSMPGPRGWPFVGSAFQLKTFSEKTLMKWAKENYGNVFRYRMFGQDCVVLNGYKAIREGLVKNDSRMSGRITGRALEAIRDNRGLFFIDYGKQWKKWKQFVVKAFGSLMEELPAIIRNEADKFDHDVLKNAAVNGNPVELAVALKRSIAQVILYAILKKEFFSREREKLYEICDDIYEPLMSAKFGIMLFIPWISYFPPFSSYIAKETSRREKLVNQFIHWIELDRNRTTDNSNPPHITKQFYAEYPDATSHQLESLSLVLIDLIFAGSATTANQLLWIILYLLKHPDMLEEVQRELDEAMENVEEVCDLYKMREKLPFTQAVIQETLRLRPIAPGSFYRKTIAEACVDGFKIPRGVVIYPNLYSAHHDPEFWGPDPETFRPDRHLNEKGNFEKLEHVIPFSMGDRKCAGVEIARANMFIFLTSILFKYDLRLSEESEDVEMTGISTSILKAPSYKILIEERSKNSTHE